MMKYMGYYTLKKKEFHKRVRKICPVDELYNPLKTIQNVMNNKYVDIWYKEKKNGFTTCI